MTPLTVKARAATFPLDQLLAIRRRGKRICLICGSDNRFAAATCDECFLGTGPMLADPDDLIVFNYGPKP
jgi:ribosomal protein L40E